MALMPGWAVGSGTYHGEVALWHVAATMKSAGTMVSMTIPDSSVAISQRDRALIDDFRTHGGEVTQGVHTGRTVLLLTTTGAKTGEQRIAPLVSTRDGDRYVIVASKGGAPAHPAWYLNLVADPLVTVEVGRGTIAARATVTEGAKRDRLFAAHAAEFPYFVGYQEKTSRVIPVVLLERLGSWR